MHHHLRSFAADEDGAVTVDWVVLTAAIIGMCLTIVAGIRAAATDPAESLGANLTEMDVG